MNIMAARLKGEKEQPSTGVAEDGGQVVIRSASSDIGTVHSKSWSMLKDLPEEANLINHLIYQRVKKRRTTEPPNSKKLRLSAPTSADYGDRKSPLDSSSDMPIVSEEHRDDDMDDMFSVFMEGVDNWDEVKDLLEDMILLINTDTGGQAEFLDLQASLVQGPSFNLLFSRLTDELECKFEVYYTNKEGQSTDKEESVLTKEEVLFQSLSSIACFCGLFASEEDGGDTIKAKSEARGYSMSKVMFVGTHYDLVIEDDFRIMDQILQQKIKSTEFFDKGIIKFFAEDQLMLAVDNMNGTQKEIDAIRERFEKIIEENFKKIEIPVSWLVLSLCIRRKKVRTMTLADCEEMAGKLKIGPEELQDALRFLHHCIGVLLYYPEVESLKYTVICEMQVLYDSATQLIMNTFTFDKVGQQACEIFREKAQFSMKLLKKAILRNTDDLIPLEKLVELLDHLNILTEIESSTPSKFEDRNFFMPCVLKRAKPRELEVAIKSSDPAPLIIHFNCGYVPVGMFPAMITNLVSTHQQEWRMSNKDLYKNRVSFKVGDDFDTVTLVSHPRFFQITISRKDDCKKRIETVSVCATVRSIVQSALSRVASSMNYHFNMGFKFGFECLSSEGKKHLCVLDKEDAWRMQSLEDQEDYPLQEQHKVWFEKTVSHGGMYKNSEHPIIEIHAYPAHLGASYTCIVLSSAL